SGELQRRELRFVLAATASYGWFPVILFISAAAGAASTVAQLFPGAHSTRFPSTRFSLTPGSSVIPAWLTPMMVFACRIFFHASWPSSTPWRFAWMAFWRTWNCVQRGRETPVEPETWLL